MSIWFHIRNPFFYSTSGNMGGGTRRTACNLCLFIFYSTLFNNWIHYFWKKNTYKIIFYSCLLVSTLALIVLKLMVFFRKFVNFKNFTNFLGSPTWMISVNNAVKFRPFYPRPWFEHIGTPRAPVTRIPFSR